MVLLDRLEAALPRLEGSLVLVTTLEPCVMCLARILLSRVRRVAYLAADPEGGGHACMSSFPSAFQQLAQDLVIGRLDWPEAGAVAEEIRDLGGDFVAKTVERR